MRRTIALISLAALVALATGCSTSVAPATADPTEVALLVEKSVQATIAAQPSPTTLALPSESPRSAPTATQIPTITPSSTPKPTQTPEPRPTPTTEPTATETPVPAVLSSKTVNLRAGPATNHPVIGQLVAGERLKIVGRSDDGSWFELCCVGDRSAWVAGSVVTVEGAVESVEVAANIPTRPPAPTPAPAAAPARPKAQLHDRQTVGSWEIQAERVQNEKAVYWYDDSKVAMGRYAIVFVLAKNLAPGTQDIAATLAPALRDDKGRIYDYSDPLTTERWAMLSACWEFSVGKTVFDDINPGVETPLLMLWDVREDVQSLTLILTDGRNRAEWDLGDFANIPPYKP